MIDESAVKYFTAFEIAFFISNKIDVRIIIEDNWHTVARFTKNKKNRYILLRGRL